MKKVLLLAWTGIVMLMLLGCGGGVPEMLERESKDFSTANLCKGANSQEFGNCMGIDAVTVTDGKVHVQEENIYGETHTKRGDGYDGAEGIFSEASPYGSSPDMQGIAAIYSNIYHEEMEADALSLGIGSLSWETDALSLETDTLSLETVRSMIDRLGRDGYVAVDSGNQVDMAGAGQAMEFCKAVDAKEKAELTMIVVDYSGGLTKYDLRTEDGSVYMTEGYYQYADGNLKDMGAAEFVADVWQYTEEGYLMFEGSYFSESYYVLLLSGVPEQAALRVQPLDEACRELNRKYILPVGYRRNNMFLTDWSEEDFADLNFYDLFDRFYPMVYGQPVPYRMDDNLTVGAVYRVAEGLFEHVIQTYISIDSVNLRSRTTYFPEDMAYEYKPRGFYEGEYLDIPYPEVVHYTENQDGTIALTVNAVYPHENTSKSYSHEVVVRPLDDGSFRYVSNRMLSFEDDDSMWWHTDRLTEGEWEEMYGVVGDK